MSETPIGYSALLKRYRAQIPRPWCLSFVGKSKSSHTGPEGVRQVFRPSKLTDDSDVGHLVFALKYDGVDLLVLKKVFAAMGGGELTDAVLRQPNSSYLRRLWFLYETLLGTRLDLPDTASTAGYAPILDPNTYYVRVAASRVQRYRVVDNLLGNGRWCPMIRRTSVLAAYEEKELHEVARDAVLKIDASMLARVTGYLANKETRASYAIEREKPSNKSERFLAALLNKNTQGLGDLWWNEERLTELQNELVDPRFAESGYRNHDVRVSAIQGYDEQVHWVGASHESLADLMDGHLDAWAKHHLVESKKRAGTVVVGGAPHAVRRSCGDPFTDFAVAGALSFGFVYIHPFGDGNGRLHRLMLQHILAITGYLPTGVPVPISAAIQKDQFGYDAVLESYSQNALRHIDYEIASDEVGALVVDSASTDLFRFIDFTAHIEALCGWFETSIEEELVHELRILRFFDAAAPLVDDIVEMPDQLRDLYVKTAYSNFERSGAFAVGKRKREKYFSMLSADEHSLMAEALHRVWDASGEHDEEG